MHTSLATASRAALFLAHSRAFSSPFAAGWKLRSLEGTLRTLDDAWDNSQTKKERVKKLRKGGLRHDKVQGVTRAGAFESSRRAPAARPPRARRAPAARARPV
jgi:hypothetical protein